MQHKEDKPTTDEKDKSAPPRRFDATLPMSGKPLHRPDDASELDLDLGDIQSRLPYGSEDIADK